MIREKERSTASGWLALAILLIALALEIYGLVLMAMAGSVAWIIAFTVLITVTVVCFFGLFTVNPNEGIVLQLFGEYVGTVRRTGLRWANPLFSKKRLSLRIRNFETQRLKVNDSEGNPIEIASVVVWRVVETAEAAFEVDNYENYVHVQSEAALRSLATNYPYDSHDEERVSLRGQTAVVAQHLVTELQERLAKAGVEVLEARISHLAYAPEIAAAMLQRQQAGAIIAARQRIVEGAVGMVEMALEMLSRKAIIDLDEERKATMVSNLLVVLCGERGAQPVLNTGSLYQ